MPTFLDWFGSPRTILVLGDGSAAASQLTAAGASVRVEKELEPDLGRFDAVFCVDLLHRLAAPWGLFAEVALVTDTLLLARPTGPGLASKGATAVPAGGWRAASG